MGLVLSRTIFISNNHEIRNYMFYMITISLFSSFESVLPPET
jgi:hypothetical protein